jgi:hypothetical protein
MSSVDQLHELMMFGATLELTSQFCSSTCANSIQTFLGDQTQKDCGLQSIYNSDTPAEQLQLFFETMQPIACIKDEGKYCLPNVILPGLVASGFNPSMHGTLHKALFGFLSNPKYTCSLCGLHLATELSITILPNSLDTANILCDTSYESIYNSNSEKTVSAIFASPMWRNLSPIPYNNSIFGPHANFTDKDFPPKSNVTNVVSPPVCPRDPVPFTIAGFGLWSFFLIVLLGLWVPFVLALIAASFRKKNRRQSNKSS